MPKRISFKQAVVSDEGWADGHHDGRSDTGLVTFLLEIRFVKATGSGMHQQLLPIPGSPERAPEQFYG